MNLYNLIILMNIKLKKEKIVMEKRSFGSSTIEERMESTRFLLVTAFDSLNAQSVEKGLARLNQKGKVQYVNVSVKLEQFALPILDVLGEMTAFKEADFYVKVSKAIEKKVNVYQDLVDTSFEELDGIGQFIKQGGSEYYAKMKQDESQEFPCVDAQIALPEELVKGLNAQAEQAGESLDAVLNRMLGSHMGAVYVMSASFSSAD